MSHSNGLILALKPIKHQGGITMNNKQNLYDYNQLHLEQLREEAEHERLVNQLPRKPGLLTAALTLLLTGRQPE